MPLGLVEQGNKIVAGKMRTATKETRRARRQSVQGVTKELKAKFKLKDLSNLKEKHIDHLLQKWKGEGRSPSWLKNNMTHVRWLCKEIGKANLVPRSNSDARIGIEKREIKYNTDKAWTPSESLKTDLPEAQRLHVELMRQFGMRFQEAGKFRPGENYKDGKVEIVYGTKGGLDREIIKSEQVGDTRSLDIRSERQRELIVRLDRYLSDRGIVSLSQEKTKYKDFVNSCTYQHRMVGMTKDGVGTPHGLRHAYAQDRYTDITGWKAPAAMTDQERKDFRSAMTAEDKEKDRVARQEISEELGHGRSQVSSNYVGSWK